MHAAAVAHVADVLVAVEVAVAAYDTAASSYHAP